MIGGGQCLGVDEIVGQGGVAELVAPHLHRVIDHLFLGPAAILLQHLAGIGIGKDRLDPRRDVAGIKRDGPGGRDRGQQRVADAMRADRLAHILVHGAHGARGQVFLGVKQGKGAFFLGQLDRGEIGGAGDGVQPVLGLLGGRVAAIAQAQHQERIGQPGHAQPDPALVLRLGGLFGQREFRGIDHVVHHPHGGGDQLLQRFGVKLGFGLERVRHEPRQVDRTQQAGAVGWQGLFATGVGGGNGLDIVQVVGRVDPVDEDHARFGIIIGGLHDLVPQGACLDRVIDLAVELQLPRAIGLDRLHEGIGDQHRHVEHAQAGGVGLGGDELFDIGMVAAHGRHHRAPAGTGGHDGAAHGVPHIHEAERPRGIGGHALYVGAARADGREVVPDAAALLHGQRRLFQHLEDAAHAVGDGAHDKAVEQRHLPRGARTGGDAPGGQIFEILQRGVEFPLPAVGILFDAGQIAGDAAPAVLDRLVDRGAVRLFETVFHVPYLLGDGGGETAHRIPQ